MGRLWLLSLVLAAAGLSGCPSPVSVESPDAEGGVESLRPDAGMPIADAGALPDSGVLGIRLRALDLTPAGSTAEGRDHRLSGSLRVLDGHDAESTGHKMRARIGPLAPR